MINRFTGLGPASTCERRSHPRPAGGAVTAVAVARNLGASRLAARLGAPSMSAKPTFDLARPRGVKFDLSPKALAHWDVGIQAKAGDGVISILEPIGEDFFGAGVTAKRIGAALRSIGDKPVTVQINSPGGDFFEGLAIYNELARHTQEVTVEVLGLAASAASVIAMAGDRVAIAKSAFLMIHNTQWVAIGDRHVMTETAAIMEKFDRAAADLYADRTGAEPAALGKLMDAETWLNAQEAVDQRFADAVLSAEPERAKGAKQAALYRVEQLAARCGLSRAEARSLMGDLVNELGKPGAAPDATPSAGDDLEGFVSFLKSK